MVSGRRRAAAPHLERGTSGNAPAEPYGIGRPEEPHTRVAVGVRRPPSSSFAAVELRWGPEICEPRAVCVS